MFAEITNPYLLRVPFPYSKLSFAASFNNEVWNSNSFRKHPLRSSRLPFLIKAVAVSADMETEQQLDEREKLRRLRISIANKGKSPWNKGRKHTPETLQKIKERTRIAMQSPKVKMKLTNLGHAQSLETKLKIGVEIRRLWEKKREIKMLQETCYFHWQNLIAQASRQGFLGQEHLQWNSYETLDLHLKQDWLETVQQRKLMPRSTSGSRAPKSLEQRKKIAQAIAAKWATTDYRERVISAIAKYHHSTERKPRPKSSYSAQTPRKRKPITKKDSGVKNSSKTGKPIKLRKRKPPAYKDPLVNSKLEMIKNIRAQRASVDTRQTQAIQQARLLIAEAEKAAKALEIAAEKSPAAHASLLETRKLIAEAIQSLESIATQKTEDCNVPSVSLSEEVNKENESTFQVGNHSQMVHEEVNKENESTFQVGNHSQMVHINGHTTLSSSVYKLSGDFGYLSLERPVNGDPELQLTNGCASLPFSLNSQINQYSSSNLEKETEQYESSKNKSDDSPAEVETLSRSDCPAEDEDETLSRSDCPAEDETLSRSDCPAEDETLSKSDSPAEDETLSKSDSPAEDETQLRSPIATKKWVRGRLVEVNEEQQ